MTDIVEQRLDEIVRLLTLSFRRTTEHQSEAILLLAQAGFGSTRIAELLGTTQGSVSGTIAKAKAKGK